MTNSRFLQAPTKGLSQKSAAALPLRRVHLDFHTSPLIADMGVEFDARAFAQTLKRAHVNSVTVFAKCHHGMCYFPSKTGTPHPALGGRDLLGEMLESLHREGIQAPIYTTIAWEEDVAARYPAWRQMHADGTFARNENPAEGQPKQPGGWHFNDWLNPDYQDYIEAQLREICDRYGREVDGFFLDIVFYERLAHYSEAARKFRAKLGLEANDAETFKRFEAAAQDQFGRRFTGLIRALRPRASVFYNGGLDITTDATSGGRVRMKHSTHLEIESLPSGFWGYFHFPRLARGAGRWGAPWIGMTGRFQKMWGDFGGIKPQAALEYECFRSQALGGGNSIGDQLPPRGTLDPAAYDLIGAVYAQCAEAEPFYQGSTEIPQIGILTANLHGAEALNASKSDAGAVQMCDEIHYDATVLDELSDLRPYALVILPDSVVITKPLLAKLKKFYAAGGKLLISHHAGRDREGIFALKFLPLRFVGDVDKYPTYWRARKEFSPQLSVSDRVFYSRGTEVIPGRGVRTLVDRVLPYFRRTDLTFSSHFQAPPVATPSKYPAVVAGKNFVYFADPIFREYREVGNLAARDIWRRVMDDLIGPPPFGAGLPTTIGCSARRRGLDLIVTLLHYIPLRKALEIDVIEERMSFAGEKLRLPHPAQSVRIFGSGPELPRDSDGAFVLPVVKGRLLLEAPGFFRP